MQKPIIYLGSDHGGFRLKEKIKKWLSLWGFEWQDLGNTTFDGNDDYPYYAFLVASHVKKDTELGIYALGILGCRTSAGMIIAANKIKGIRAVAAHTPEIAKVSRTHNDANVLALAGDLVSDREAKKILKAWMSAKFNNERRHRIRLGQIQNFEKKIIEITPGIFEKKIEDVEKKIAKVYGLTTWIHVDIADGKLVNNISNLDSHAHKNLFAGKNIELHLMVENPTEYVKTWRMAGASRMFAHIEAKNIPQFIKVCRKYKVRPGIAIDLQTDWTKIKRYVKSVEWILIMSVKAGFSGQQFEASALDKVDSIKEHFPDSKIVVDGGISDVTISATAAAGADRVITTSYLFKGSGNIQKKIDKITNFHI